MPPKARYFTLLLPVALYEAAAALAASDDRPVAYVFRKAVEVFLAQQTAKKEIPSK